MKWGGAVASTILLIAWVGSIFVNVGWTSLGGDGIGYGTGGVSLWQGHIPVPSAQAGWYMPPNDPQLSFWFVYEAWGNNGWALFVPLWIPLGFAVVFTADAWYMAARTRRGDFRHLCTKCGYDRTGLAPSAVCPECGTPAPDAPAAL